MKLLMLSDVYFPRVNGVSTSIRTFAKSLVARGHRVTLIAPDYAGDASQPAHDAELGKHFEVIRLPSRKIFFDPEDRLIKAGALRAAHVAVGRRHWDVIHVHTPFRAHQLGVRMGHDFSVPVVESYHTYFEQYVAHYLPWMPAAMLRTQTRWMSRRLCQAVDHLIVPTTEMDQVLRAYGVSTPATVLATGIDPDEFRGGDGAAFRARHGIDPLQPVLVTVSRLAVEKNIAFLLQVVRALVAQFPTLVFVIAGEGPDASRLRARVQRLGLEAHVRFFGNLDRNTTLLDCYRAGNAFVFASPTETQGLVLTEAMALGVPIVSTAVMGTATVLRDAHSAIVRSEDVADFAEGVARVLRDPALQATLSAAGPRDAQAWHVEPLMEQVVALYAALAAGRR